MDYETNIKNSEHVYKMNSLEAEDLTYRQEIQSLRQTIIAAQWAKVSYQLRKYQRKQVALIKNDSFHFWVKSSKNRMILMAVMQAHFDKKRISPEMLGKDLGYARSTVNKLLKEGREKGLLITRNKCSYKPSQDTIDGFIFYSNETMSMDAMLRLAAGVIRLNTGAFQEAVTQPQEPDRISIVI
jgi:biotin operon repressor